MRDNRSAARRDAAPLTGSRISVRFGGLAALEDVDVRLSPGEVLGVIGPNGAGKTTLINVLNGFQPSTGEITVGDVPLSRLPTHRRARLGFGRSFQGARVFSSLTVAENVEVGALNQERSRRKARALVADVLDRVGLRPWADTPAAALPFGAERMVGLARVLAMQPTLVLLDEPAAGLNERESDELRDVVASMRDEDHIGVLIVEHDMRLIMNLCDRVQVLSFGKTIAVGTPDEVRTDPAVIDAYLGEPVT